MNRPLRQLWHARPGRRGALWVVASVAAVTLAPASLRKQAGDTTEAVAGVLWQARWILPLAVTAVVAILTSRRARNLWPRRSLRLQLGLALFVGLVGLTATAIAVGPRRLLLVVGLVGVTGLLVAGIVVRPRRLAPSLAPSELERLSDVERLEAIDSRVKLRNDLVATPLQSVTVLAVVAGVLLTFQQFAEDRQRAAAERVLTRQGQAGERFTRAVEQLGSDRQGIQLGGIYGLGQIAKQDPESREVVAQVLVGYLRSRTAEPVKPPTNPPVELGVRAPDVQAVLTVLGQPDTASPDAPLELRKLDLNGANLIEADLTSADLTEANLSDTTLTGAFLDRANFTSAFLNRANLTGASMIGATFDQAELIEAELTHAKLTRARLVNMRLTMADLTGADLRAADLRGADLTGADLTGAVLEGADLTGAVADGATSWPSGFSPRARGVHFP